MIGLTEKEAEEYRKKFGLNTIPEKKKNPVIKFLSYFWGPIPWMIEVAALLSLVIHHMVDFWIILILLFSNAVVGFIEEHSAENVIEILKRKMALVAELPEKDMIEDILHMGLCLFWMMVNDIAKMITMKYVKIENEMQKAI